MMKMILSNTPVKVIRKSVVTRAHYGRKAYVEPGDVVFCLCAKPANEEWAIRVRLPGGFVGNIKREHVKSLSALELLGMMSDDSFDGDFEDA